jgi:hypothetical protein
MLHLTLNEVEIAILKSLARKGDANEEYRALITALSNLVDQRTGHLWLGPEQVAKIQKFAFRSQNMTWQASLLSILSRTLGPTLGGSQENLGQLTR